MNNIMLVDFGSTYTKVTALDLDQRCVVGTASAFTTVDTDIDEGYQNALGELNLKIGKREFLRTVACSSAAGGLRMMTSGLVESLTAEAAKRAALGAGAKVVRVFSFELTGADIREIEQGKPDIFLLTGGTDGGNKECVLANAKALCRIKGDFPIVYAGNRSAQEECHRLLGEAGKRVISTQNVMPSFNVLNVTPAQGVIRDIFLQNIVHAKGLSRIGSLLDEIICPTPAAVLDALELLSSGIDGNGGMGDIAAVDLGGATTDVYSIADGAPKLSSTIVRGLPEPHSKRTVEGDLGMRYSAAAVAQEVGLKALADLSGLSQARVQAHLDAIAADYSMVAKSAEEVKLDNAIAAAALKAALTRHAGTLESAYTPNGIVFMQTGKDLTEVGTLIATGGALIHSPDINSTVEHAMFDPNDPLKLRPRNARVLIDKKYILCAMGLLSRTHPDIALEIMKKELAPKIGVK